MPTSTVERPVTPLRQRMLEDMAMRGLRSDTQRNYIAFVRSFAAFLGRPPDTATAEFIRRFLLHVLPRGFHRIRHYGLLASAHHKAAIARARELLDVAPPPEPIEPEEPIDARPPCPCCGGHMVVIETFERWCQPRAPPRAETPTGSVAP